VDGERLSFTEEVPHPEGVANATAVDLGRFRMEFLAPQKTFRICFEGPEQQLDMTLDATLPMFDYGACIETNPDEYSLSDSTSQGFGVFRHQNQTMAGTGRLRFKDGRPERRLAGAGYRDHSWGMRDDNLTLRHTWAWMSFPDATLHVTLVNSQHRPELWAREGYWGTSAGNLALQQCSAGFEGDSFDGLPAKVHFNAVDALGGIIAVDADIAGAYARNRFMSSRPGAKAYVMRHNFCKCTRASDGCEGIAMVEIGAAEDSSNSTLSSGRTERA
jgi:hypothetical protein